MIPCIAVAFVLLAHGSSSAALAGNRRTDTPPPVATSAALDDINTQFNNASNRALFYAGSPNADPTVMRQMRRLYIESLGAVHTLNHGQRKLDYEQARQAISRFAAFVDQHPPGVIVPPVVSAAD